MGKDSRRIGQGAVAWTGSHARVESLLAARLLRIVPPLALLVLTGCGYQVRSSVQNLPGGIQSLGIPTFINVTHQYKVEQQITRAVLKEFSARTRIPINSSSSGVDAVLAGEIRGF